jgi:hypothetical protein
MRHFEEFHKAESPWHDGILVPFGVRTKKVRLDLFHVARFGNATHLINVSTKVQETGCEHDESGIGLEVKGVHFVKA